MTIVSIIACLIISAILIGVGAFIRYLIKDASLSSTTPKSANAVLAITIILSIACWIGFGWYYNNTAAGQRDLKSQRSELGDGITRELTVYDMQGEVIETYKGKFDIDFSSDQSGQRIVFDDENGIRHVIYPGGGIVIINEVSE